MLSTERIGFYILSCLIALSTLLIAGCTETKQNTIVLAHAMHTNHPVSEAMEFMAKRLREKSDGELTIKIYPNRQLGSERELLELVQIGTVDITKVSAANLETFVPEFLVFSLPYLFRDKNHVDKVLWGEVGREILLSGTDRGFRGLTYYDAGLRSFYTREQPVRHPDDLSGLKIRVQESAMAINFIKTLSGSPTPLSYGELYTALQSGIVDGAENNYPSYFSSRHYEVTDHLSLTEHASVPDILLTSTRVWSLLSEKQQQWVQEAARESAVYQRKIWAESVKESRQEIKEAGVEIIDPNRKAFIEMVEPMHKQFEQQNPELFDLVERIQKVNEETEETQEDEKTN